VIANWRLHGNHGEF